MPSILMYRFPAQLFRRRRRDIVNPQLPLAGVVRVHQPQGFGQKGRMRTAGQFGPLRQRRKLGGVQQGVR